MQNQIIYPENNLTKSIYIIPRTNAPPAAIAIICHALCKSSIHAYNKDKSNDLETDPDKSAKVFVTSK